MFRKTEYQIGTVPNILNPNIYQYKKNINLQSTLSDLVRM